MKFEDSIFHCSKVRVGINTMTDARTHEPKVIHACPSNFFLKVGGITSMQLPGTAAIRTQSPTLKAYIYCFSVVL